MPAAQAPQRPRAPSVAPPPALRRPRPSAGPSVCFTAAAGAGIGDVAWRGAGAACDAGGAGSREASGPVRGPSAGPSVCFTAAAAVTACRRPAAVTTVSSVTAATTIFVTAATTIGH